MVAEAAGKGAAHQGIQKVLGFHTLVEVTPDDSSLGSKKGFVCRSSDNIGPLQERLLEVGADETQDMSHIVHDQGLFLPCFYHCPQRGQRLAMQNHALPQDDEFRLMAIQKLFGTLQVDLVGIFL